MPAPTALQRVPDESAVAEKATAAQEPLEQEDDFVIDATQSAPNSAAVIKLVETTQNEEDVSMTVDEEGRPRFAPATISQEAHMKEMRKVAIPPHRMTPLKNSWPKIYPPLVEHLLLQVRMNTQTKSVEMRTSKHTSDPGALQKGADFVQAFALGFDIDDAIALLRLDDLYIRTFEVKDVKNLQGEHMSRAIGRIAGKDGKMKYAIENASKTRIVLADQKIHILGGFRNIDIAQDAVSNLILGSPPAKVYGNLRTVANRMKERF